MTPTVRAVLTAAALGAALSVTAVAPAVAQSLSDLDDGDPQARYAAFQTAIQVHENCRGDLSQMQHQEMNDAIMAELGVTLGGGEKLGLVRQAEARANSLTSGGCGSGAVQAWRTEFVNRLGPLIGVTE